MSGFAMRFRLAPMSPGLLVLTVVLLALPLLIGAAAFTTPPPANVILISVTTFFVLVYASIWLGFRPTGFVIEADALTIVWPVRARVIAREDVEDARIIDVSEFRREYGYGMRVGAGGLWGGFGLLKTGRETFSMWISRTDCFVIVRLRGARPLLVTPEDPARFVAALTSR